MSSATFESAVESALRLELQVRRQRYLKLAAWGAVAIAALGIRRSRSSSARSHW